MGSKKDSKSAMKEVFEYWIWKQPMLLKVFLAVMALVLSFTAMKLILKDNNHFFIASELTHATGIVALIYKLTTKRTCSGLSLKSQELTAMFLAVRVVCSFMLEGDIHTLLDLATFVFTAWLIFMIRSNLKSTYIKDLDNFPLYSMVVPCAILAVLIHPRGSDMYISRLLWAFCVYLEAVSVTPQLRMMQNAKMIEPVTAHYVFALGVARFLSCANWIIQVYETGGTYLFLVGYGYLWFPMAILAEIVQTFILVDFCYYYIKSFMQGQLIIRMPV
ncbi:ER lumen protein-retaining receptor erd-2.2-like [Hibiscus syriacus]|uniref:ER lumen protein-retaining receptor erd-2.2-like n=1 Tax=Hibiscus syriacus TaxID=106335 RepID=UPI001924E5E2|nr:ER lumen protein-retaining receptor erd-2.2-like [Hibiscus syriacus]